VDAQRLPTLESVEVEPDEEERGFVVTPVYTGVDRPRSYSVLATKLAEANRLKAAILAGAVFPVRGVLTDMNGQTYVDFDHNVMGRHLNADLKKLGF
jgi:hypothetical protein